MSDGFAEMVVAARTFFAELAANNSKDWYEPRKDSYAATIRKPAEFMADLLAEDLSRLTGRSLHPKVFRLHRDVRFSKDKTPYNTHLHMMWQSPGNGPAFFFGAAPDYLVMGLAAMGLEGDRLSRYRTMIDHEGDDLSDALAQCHSAIGASFSDWGTPPLKRVPKPYDDGHAHADLLRRRSFALSADLPATWQERGLMPTLTDMARAYMPLWQHLDALR
jgi:uncharacterized protein (TIGR02453 family)